MNKILYNKNKNMNKITKQKARKAFDGLFSSYYDTETKHYQEFYNKTSIHPEDMMIEDLEESVYKNLRIIDKYFNPKYWRDENNE